MDALEQRTVRLGHDGTSGPLLLLALADRELLQAAQKPRPTTGTMATRNRHRDRATVVGGRHGVRGGLATATRRLPGGDQVQGRVGASERPTNEEDEASHSAGVAGRLVGAAVDAG